MSYTIMMSVDRKNISSQAGRSSPAAFLLAQVGAHAAQRFGERLSELQLAPPHAGILRILDATPAITQQALALKLRMVPSRLVALLDEMQALGLTERREDREDRRRHSLHLTQQGRDTLASVGRIAREHQEDLLTALSAEERQQLAGFLQRIADQQNLSPGVHPGYARLGSVSVKKTQ